MRWKSDPAVARFTAQAGTGPLLPGDLLYFGASATDIHHTAVYLGGGYIVEVPFTGAKVRVNTVSNHGDYFGAIRLHLPSTLLYFPQQDEQFRVYLSTA